MTRLFPSSTGAEVTWGLEPRRPERLGRAGHMRVGGVLLKLVFALERRLVGCPPPGWSGGKGELGVWFPTERGRGGGGGAAALPSLPCGVQRQSWLWGAEPSWGEQAPRPHVQGHLRLSRVQQLPIRPPLRQSSSPGKRRGRRGGRRVAAFGGGGSAAWEAGRWGREGRPLLAGRAWKLQQPLPHGNPAARRAVAFFRPERVAPCRRERSPSPQQPGEAAAAPLSLRREFSSPVPPQRPPGPPGRSVGAGRARACQPWARAPQTVPPPESPPSRRRDAAGS